MFAPFGPWASRLTRGGRRLWPDVPGLAADLDSHATGGALDHAHRRVDRVGVQIAHLDLSDRADLRPADLPHLDLVRLTGALLDAGLLADEVGRGRAFGDEGVRTVLEDRH